MTIRRKRGRPRGSGKNDAPSLARIANFIVREPTMTPTKAIKKVLGRDWRESDVHRLHLKWRNRKVALLEAAHERARPKSHMELIASLSNLPVMRSAQALLNHKVFLKLRVNLDALNAPALSMQKLLVNDVLLRQTRFSDVLKSTLMLHKQVFHGLDDRG